MSKAVIENWDQFSTYLASQPLCQWCAQKQRELADGLHVRRDPRITSAPKKDDKAELAAALSSMA